MQASKEQLLWMDENLAAGETFAQGKPIARLKELT